MRRWITLLLAAAVVAGGMAVNALNDAREPYSPYPVPVVLGEDSAVGPVDVHLREVAATTQVGRFADWADEWDSLVETEGVFVMVEFSHAARSRRASILDLTIMDSQGRTFPETSRAYNARGYSDPGIWRATRTFFEVPRDAVDGELQVRFYTASRFQDYPVPYGRAHVRVDGVQSEPIEIRYSETLPADQR